MTYSGDSELEVGRGSDQVGGHRVEVAIKFISRPCLIAVLEL